MTAAARTEPTAVATTNDGPKGLVGLLQNEKAKAQILPFLRGENYERVVQEVILAASANPELRQCTPQSLIAAVARAVSWQGVIGEDVHLVPFNVNVGTREEPNWEKRATPMKDYKFKAKLIVATGAARQVYAVAVYKNEPFAFTQGTQPTIQHQIILDEKGRGAMVGAYAVAMIRAGQFQIVSKTVGEIDKVRKSRSKSWRDGELPEWYALKTVIHQLAKLLPTNPKLAKLIEEEEEIEEGTLDSGPVTIVAAPAQQRLTTGTAASHFDAERGRPIALHSGYDAEPQAERDETGRPTPRETTITDERIAPSATADEPRAPAESTAASEPGIAGTDNDIDIITNHPLTEAGRWEIPAGDLRGRMLGRLSNDELLAFRESASGLKKYNATIEMITELLDERREYAEG